MAIVSIKYRERPTPGFRHEFTYVENFSVKSEDAIGFIKDMLIAFYLYHPTNDFEGNILDVWANIYDGEEVRKISWEDSDESDFRMFYTNLK